MKTIALNAVLVVSSANLFSTLYSMGEASERIEAGSKATVEFLKAEGIDISNRKEVSAYLIGEAYAKGLWVENPSKKGMPASIDVVRLGGVIRGEKKADVPLDARRIAKGIYATLQWIADNSEEQANTDSLKKIMEAIAGANARLDNFAAEGAEHRELVLKVQGLLSEVTGLMAPIAK